jgi:hypothetical protein
VNTCNETEWIVSTGGQGYRFSYSVVMKVIIIMRIKSNPKSTLWQRQTILVTVSEFACI